MAAELQKSATLTAAMITSAYEDGARRMITASNDTVAAVGQVEVSTTKATSALKLSSEGWDAWLAKIDPATKAGQQYSKLQAELNEYQKAGLISANDLSSAHAALAQRFEGASVSADGLNKVLGIGRELLGAFGLALSVGSVVEWGRGVFEATAQLENQAKVLGISVEALQAYHAAAVVSGADADAGDNALRRFTRAIGDATEKLGPAREAFMALHLTSVDLAGGTEAVLPKVAQSLLAIQDASERARIEVALMGKAGQESEAFLEKWADPEIINHMKEMGLVVDESIIKRAHQAEVAWSTFFLHMKAGFAEMIFPPTVAELESREYAPGTSGAMLPIMQSKSPFSVSGGPHRSWTAPQDSDWQTKDQIAQATADAAFQKLINQGDNSFVRSFKINGTGKVGDPSGQQLGLSGGYGYGEDFQGGHQLGNASADVNAAEAMRQKIREINLDADKKDAEDLGKFHDEEAKAWDSYFQKVAEANQKVQDEIAKTGSRVIDDFGSAIVQGNLSWDSFAKAGVKALQDIESELLKMAVINPLKNSLFGEALPTLGGGSGGGFLKSLFSGFFADGGTLTPGTWGIAGENGPEPIYAGSTPLSVVPNGAGGGGTQNISIVVNAPGATVETAHAIALQVAQQVVAQTAPAIAKAGAALAFDKMRNTGRG